MASEQALGDALEISKDESFEVVGEAGTGEEALELCRKMSPNAVALDVSLPDISGLDLIEQLLGTVPDIKILMVSMHLKADYIAKAFEAGALGYITKESACDRLLEGLRMVGKGDCFIDSACTREVMDKFIYLSGAENEVKAHSYNALTDREQEILRFLAEGHSSKIISHNLNISSKTVDNHRGHIMKKLKLNTVAELINYASELGISNS